MDVDAPPAESPEQRRARERAEAQADARNTRATQSDVQEQTRALIRRFGLLAAIAAGANIPASSGFTAPITAAPVGGGTAGGGGAISGGGGGGSPGGGGGVPTSSSR